MSEVLATRRLKFDAGHRVMNHESKCRHLHGHQYIVHASAKAKDGLDSLGRVIDFSCIKERLGVWLDENWDHGMIVYKEDTEVLEALSKMETQKIYVHPTNPTAENMGLHLIHDICPKLFEDTGVEIVELLIHETENCCVKVTK